MQRMNHIKEIIESGILKGKQVVIIGAALTGKNTCNDLQKKGISVACFIDENPAKQGKTYYGVPVRNVMDDSLRKSAVAILCCHPLAALSEEDFLKCGFIERIGVSESQLVILDREKGALEITEKCFQKFGIDTSKEYLDVLGFRIPNYLSMEENIRLSFLQECGDLLLPKVFNEYEALMEGPYEDDDFCMPPEGGVIFDCGANIGLFSAIAARNPKNHVYAFEPILQTLSILQKLQIVYSNITIVPIALADYDGEAYMSDSKDLGTNKLVESKNGIDVTVKTLDRFVEDNQISHVDFIKADIEGAERKMLSGAKNVLARFAPKLSICTYHLDDDPEVLERIIKDANPRYQVLQKRNKLYAYVDNGENKRR